MTYFALQKSTLLNLEQKKKLKKCEVNKVNSINHRQICFKAETLKVPVNNHEDLVYITDWTKKLIARLDMKIIIGPNFYYVTTHGNEGWTGGCNIETSHFAMHWWERPNLNWLILKNPNSALLQADIYTCGQLKQKQIDYVLSSIEVFSPIYMEYMILNREKNFEVKEIKKLYCRH